MPSTNYFSFKTNPPKAGTHKPLCNWSILWSNQTCGPWCLQITKHHSSHTERSHSPSPDTTSASVSQLAGIFFGMVKTKKTNILSVIKWNFAKFLEFAYVCPKQGATRLYFLSSAIGSFHLSGPNCCMIWLCWWYSMIVGDCSRSHYASMSGYHEYTQALMRSGALNDFWSCWCKTHILHSFNLFDFLQPAFSLKAFVQQSAR